MNVGVSDAINGIKKLGDEELTLFIYRNDKRLLESLNNANHQELLVLYHTEVEKYYDELIKYKEDAEIRDKRGDETGLDNFKNIKDKIMIIYMKITKIRMMINTSNDKMIFNKIKDIEVLITNSIFLIERRNNMHTKHYISDIERRLLEIEELKTELLPNIKFLILILRTKDTGDLPLYIQQPPKDNLPPPPTNTGNRLQMLSAKVAAQPPQQQAHIVPAVVRRDIGKYRNAQAAQEAAEAGISPRPRQSAKAAAGLRPASGAPRNRGIVPSDTPLSPPPYSQRPPTLYRRTSAAAAAASSNLPPTIIAQPPVYRRRIILGEETINGDYERGVYPSHLLPNNVVPVDKLKISPPVLPARRGSHSFKSNSPYNDEKPEFDIEGDVRNPPEVYLIDNKNDGLCFLNAIFDYLLYSGKLPTMYERLLAIEDLILENYGMDINVLKIKKAALSLISADTDDIFKKKLIPVSQAREIYYIKQNEQGQLIRLDGDRGLRFKDRDNKVEHLGHPEGKKTYEERRKKFAISMKYVLALYILSYGKKKFIDMIVFTLTAETSHIEWTKNLLKTFKDKYESNLDVDGFVYEYVLEYLINKDFFVNHSLIVMFKKILFKKIKKPSGENIPRFWLEIATIFMDYEMARVPRKDEYPDLRTFTDDKGNRKFERVLNKYRFKASGAAQSNKYIHTDNYDNYISLLCDNNRTHYLLFLLKKEIKYPIMDKPRGGGKPKRAKTTTKPKRPKTAAKPKRPKTAK